MDKIRHTLPPVERPLGSQAAHLRKVLNVMFPHSYLKLYHRPPYSVCSIFKTKTTQCSEEELEDSLEASSEPASRAQILSLQKQLQGSLAEHQAKLVGLCPIRRAIYDQCFGRCWPQLRYILQRVCAGVSEWSYWSNEQNAIITK